MQTIKVSNPDKFRANIADKFCAHLPKEKDATNLEKGIYNWAIKEATNHKIVKNGTASFKPKARAIKTNTKPPPKQQQIHSPVANVTLKNALTTRCKRGRQMNP
jgi:hypothetical protein